jgi:hypothetical protein
MEGGEIGGNEAAFPDCGAFEPSATIAILYQRLEYLEHVTRCRCIAAVDRGLQAAGVVTIPSQAQIVAFLKRPLKSDLLPGAGTP